MLKCSSVPQSYFDIITKSISIMFFVAPKKKICMKPEIF